MKIITALLLMVAFAAIANDDIVTFKDWNYNSYYHDYSELGIRSTHDAWTTARDRSFVLSCAISQETGDKSLKMFIATNDPINKFGKPVTVTITIGRDLYRFDGNVSNNYVGNVHVELPTKANDLFERMRKGRRFNIEIPVISGAYYIRQEFSLMGFHRASLNTITNCIY